MINYNIKIFDDFLDPEDLNEISAYAKNLNNERNINVFHNEIDLNNLQIDSKQASNYFFFVIHCYWTFIIAL